MAQTSAKKGTISQTIPLVRKKNFPRVIHSHDHVVVNCVVRHHKRLRPLKLIQLKSYCRTMYVIRLSLLPIRPHLKIILRHLLFSFTVTR
ncbi:Uncharacterized protein BM_BM17130 [Brugia malayi]|uniref:Uncharacterized protein n=1 Tax=Brugia malayi TaxID=6279 RepID=A0A4E9G044_BRUMA|nr:Uncharacterized protein BM_BM17130 [Brugia malayi]VIP00043.1 Uncharacterized protein BM_BM17130 [Brugia malayi]